MGPNMRRVCVVTGAAGELGSCICERLSAEYDVFGTYHERLPTTFSSQIVRSFDPFDRSSLERQPPNTPYLLKANLKNLDEIEKVVEVCMARFGKIDLLVNAAADIRFYGELSYARKYLASAQDQFFLNAFVPILLTSAFAEHFWKHKSDENKRSNRNIVNVSSVSGLNIYPGVGQGVYRPPDIAHLEKARPGDQILRFRPRTERRMLRQKVRQ